MTLSFHDNDDVLFDRLVDGELSVDQRRQLVASLDDRADGWRRCALAFLESQSWGGAMKRIATEGVAPAKPLVLATPAIGSKPARMTQFPPLSWLATAAGLLVAFALGWQLSDQPAADAPTLVADQLPSAPPLPQHEAAPLPDDDAITLVVQDHQGVPRRVQAPLVEGNRLGKQFADAPPWAAPQVREQFERGGLDLTARRRYVPLYFEQQNRVVPMIVPVDDAVITPVSRPIY